MNTRTLRISVKKGREWHIRRGHPWLFSGGISQAPGKASPGELVELLDSEGDFVATGYYNPACDIAVRVLSRVKGERIDRRFLADRIRSAWALRQQAINLGETDVFRLINAEGDFLPGFIVDYYDGIVSVQSHTAGSDNLLEEFLAALDEVVDPRVTVLRNDVGVRKREGLEPQPPRVVKGELNGPIEVKENGHSFEVDLLAGQKTGFFTDQRDKRAAIANYASRLPTGSSLLNCFCYTASFSIYACRANWNIKTVNIDESIRALDEAKRNFALNGIDLENHEFISKDVFSYLDDCIEAGTTHDIVILDPPAFAKTAKDKPRALKAYARMARQGISVTKPGGLLVLCSCSGSIDLNEFLDTTSEAIGTSGRSAQLVETFQHGCDHPTNLMAAEGSYLKVIFLRV